MEGIVIKILSKSFEIDTTVFNESTEELDIVKVSTLLVYPEDKQYYPIFRHCADCNVRTIGGIPCAKENWFFSNVVPNLKYHGIDVSFDKQLQVGKDE